MQSARKMFTRSGLTNIGEQVPAKQIVRIVRMNKLRDTGDIACITKTPPYSKVSSNLGKKRIPKRIQSFVDTGVNLQREAAPQQTINTSLTKSSGEETRVKPTEETPQKYQSTSNYGIIEYEGHRIEIKDDLSYAFAVQIMKKIKKELLNKVGRGGLFEDF